MAVPVGGNFKAWLRRADYPSYSGQIAKGIVSAWRVNVSGRRLDCGRATRCISGHPRRLNAGRAASRSLPTRPSPGTVQRRESPCDQPSGLRSKGLREEAHAAVCAAARSLYGAAQGARLVPTRTRWRLSVAGFFSDGCVTVSNSGRGRGSAVPLPRCPARHVRPPRPPSYLIAPGHTPAPAVRASPRQAEAPGTSRQHHPHAEAPTTRQSSLCHPQAFPEGPKHHDGAGPRSQRPGAVPGPLQVGDFGSCGGRPRHPSYIRTKHICLRRASADTKHPGTAEIRRACGPPHTVGDFRVGHMGRLQRYRVPCVSICTCTHMPLQRNTNILM